jgi:hypothetical protein
MTSAGDATASPLAYGLRQGPCPTSGGAPTGYPGSSTPPHGRIGALDAVFMDDARAEALDTNHHPSRCEDWHIHPPNIQSYGREGAGLRLRAATDEAM